MVYSQNHILLCGRWLIVIVNKCVSHTEIWVFWRKKRQCGKRRGFLTIGVTSNWLALQMWTYCVNMLRPSASCLWITQRSCDGRDSVFWTWDLELQHHVFTSFPCVSSNVSARYSKFLNDVVSCLVLLSLWGLAWFSHSSKPLEFKGCVIVSLIKCWFQVRFKKGLSCLYGNT